MLTSKILGSVFEFIYYSHLQFCFVAMSLTAASGVVLVGRAQWQPVLIVGLSTYSLYNLDNLFDAKNHRGSVEKDLWWKIYFYWCIFSIPLALIGVFVLSLQAGSRLLILLSIFGVISFLHVIITRDRSQISKAFLYVENLIDSLVWALVVVLIPVVYADGTFKIQVVLAIAYTWLLCWIGAVIWDFRSPVPEYELQGTIIRTSSIEEKPNWMLIIVCLAAITLAVIDVALGFFPWYNLSVILAPTGYLILFLLWKKYIQFERIYKSLFYFGGIIGSLSVVIAYYLFN
jgi:hypothetical protein